MDARVERARPVREVVLQVERYIEREIVNFDVIEPAPAIKPAGTAQGSAWADAVAEVRARIEKAAADKQAAIDAPWPSEPREGSRPRRNRALAEKGTPSVMALLESERRRRRMAVSLPAAGISDARPQGGRPCWRDGYMHDPMPFSVWLHKDELIRRIEAEIDAKADDRSALDPVQRAKKSRAGRSRPATRPNWSKSALSSRPSRAGVVIARRATPMCAPSWV